MKKEQIETPRVQTYEMTIDRKPGAVDVSMEPEPSGRWVKLSDYNALQRELSSANTALEEARRAEELAIKAMREYEEQVVLQLQRELEEVRRERDSIYAAIEDWCCKPEAVEGQATAFRDKFYEYKQRALAAESSLEETRRERDDYKAAATLHADACINLTKQAAAAELELKEARSQIPYDLE